MVNGSFENVTSCDFSSGINYASGWTNLYPAQNSTGVDLFGPCAFDPIFSVPYSATAFQLAKDGMNYAGFVPAGQVESPLGTLSSPLIADSVYSVELFLNLWNKSGQAVAGLGLKFFETLVSLPVESYDTLVADIVEPDFITDTLYWTQLSTLYTARGGEHYFAIGLYDTIVRINTGFGLGSAYYFIDAINIHKATQSEINGVKENRFNFSVYPNPVIDKLNIESKTPIAEVWVGDLAGKHLLKQTFRQAQGDPSIDASGLPSGIYLIEVVTEDGKHSVQKAVVSPR